MLYTCKPQHAAVEGGSLGFSLHYDLCKENTDEFGTPTRCSHPTKPEFSSSHRCVAGLDTYILGC